MNFPFLSISLSKTPVRTLGTFSAVRLRASFFSRTRLKIGKFMGLVPTSRTLSKIAKFIEDGLGFVSNSQVVKFSLSKMEKSIEDGLFFHFRGSL